MQQFPSRQSKTQHWISEKALGHLHRGGDASKDGWSLRGGEVHEIGEQTTREGGQGVVVTSH